MQSLQNLFRRNQAVKTSQVPTTRPQQLDSQDLKNVAGGAPNAAWATTPPGAGVSDTTTIDSGGLAK